LKKTLQNKKGIPAGLVQVRLRFWQDIVSSWQESDSGIEAYSLLDDMDNTQVIRMRMLLVNLISAF